MIKKFGPPLMVCVSNYWIWKIFEQSYLLALILVAISLLLIFKSKFIAIISVILLGIFLLKTNFDTNIMYVSSLTNDQLNDRHEYFAQSLGKLYRNRVGIYYHNIISPRLSTYTKNLAYTLDPNLYFFAAHPRERVEADEFRMFPIIALPLFLLGLTAVLSGGQGLLITYFLFSALISGFVFSGYSLGPILMLPFFNALIYLGLFKVFRRII